MALWLREERREKSDFGNEVQMFIWGITVEKRERERKGEG